VIKKALFSIIYLAPSHSFANTEGGYSTSELISKSAIDSIFPVEVHAKMFKHKGRNVRITAIRDLTERKKGPGDTGLDTGFDR
jgi:hypothetical protein